MTCSLGQECLKNTRNSLLHLLSLRGRSRRRLVELLGGYPRTSCLTKEAQQLRSKSATVLRERRCYKCKQIGHLRKHCPLRVEVPGHSTQAANTGNVEAAEVSRNAEDLTEAQLRNCWQNTGSVVRRWNWNQQAQSLLWQHLRSKPMPLGPGFMWKYALKVYL